jgi:acetyltransferase
MVSVRPMEPSDLGAVSRLFDQLSDESRYQRFFSRGRAGLLYELGYLQSLDGCQRVALVAESAGEIIGLARYHLTGAGHAEVAVVVADAWQHRGVGHRLLRDLTDLARGHGVETIDVSMLGDNLAALRLLRGLAGRHPLHLDHGVFEASIPLAG